MPNLKDIRRRIKSVKNTQKITQAMRMVAAAKVKRAEAAMRATRPFATALEALAKRVFPTINQALVNDKHVTSLYAATLLRVNTDVKRVALVVMTSDRGLCGAYNATVLRRLVSLFDEYEAQDIKVRLYLVGNKAIQFVRKRYPHANVLGRLSGCSVAPTLNDADTIAQSLLPLLTTDQIDRVDILSTEFKTMVSSQVAFKTLYPLPFSTEAPEPDLNNTAPLGELLIEPDCTTVVDVLIPMFVKRRLHAALLEASASELAARMTSMANATDNAKAMIQDLTLVYNKARQASITQEIMEIVGGAEALRG